MAMYHDQGLAPLKMVAFESGVAARLLGTVPSVVVGGAITVAVAVVTNWVFPSLAKLDSFADYAAAAEPGGRPITRDPPSAPS